MKHEAPCFLRFFERIGDATLCPSRVVLMVCSGCHLVSEQEQAEKSAYSESQLDPSGGAAPSLYQHGVISETSGPSTVRCESVMG